MKNLLKLLGAFSLLGVMFSVSQAAQTCQRTDFFCYESGPTANLLTPARLDANGNLTLLGNDTITGNSTTSGSTIYPPTTSANLVTASILSPAGTYELLAATGPMTITAISTTGIAGGQYMILSSTSDIAQVTISSGTSSATGVGLGSSTRALGTKSKLVIIYDAAASIWHEVSYTAQ